MIAHMNQDARLIFVLSGTIIIEQNDKVRQFSVGEFFLVPNFSTVQVTISDKSSRIYQITLSYQTVPQQDQLSIFTGDSLSCGESAQSTLTQAIGKLLRLYYLSREDVSYWEVNALYFQIIAKLEQKYLVKTQKQEGQLTENSVMGYVEQHLSDELTPESVANHFYVSKQTMNRFVKSRWGLPLGKFIQEKRFEFFEKLLVTTDISVNTLAYEAGFKNINSFNRLFKAKYGESPLAWREHHRIECTTENQEDQLLVEEDFLELDTKGEYHFVADCSRVHELKPKPIVWTVSDPTELIGNVGREQLSKITAVFPQSIFRLVLDLSHNPAWLYDVVLKDLMSIKGQICLVVNIETISEVTQALHYLEAFALAAETDGRNMLFEIVYQQEFSDWVGEYNRVCRKLVERFPACKCGVGNISLIANNQMPLETLEFLQIVNFVSCEIVPEIDHFSLYSRRNQIVRHSKISLLRPLVMDGIAKIREMFPNTELYIGRFGLTADESDAINDHVYMASYLLAFLNTFLPYVDGIGGYQLLDAKMDKGQEFSGRPGLITKSGLLKAPYYALVFLWKLHTNQLLKEENLLVTFDGHKNIRLLAFSHQPINDYYSSDREMDLYHHQQMIFPMKSELIQLEILHLMNGRYKLTYQVLDIDNGSGPIVKNKYTGISQLDEKMVDYIQSQYRPRLYQKAVDVETNKLTEKLILKPFEVLLVEIEKIDEK